MPPPCHHSRQSQENARLHTPDLTAPAPQRRRDQLRVTAAAPRAQPHPPPRQPRTTTELGAAVGETATGGALPSQEVVDVVVPEGALAPVVGGSGCTSMGVATGAPPLVLPVVLPLVVVLPTVATSSSDVVVVGFGGSAAVAVMLVLPRLRGDGLPRSCKRSAHVAAAGNSVAQLLQDDRGEHTHTLRVGWKPPFVQPSVKRAPSW
jgi:hypothetical protein